MWEKSHEVLPSFGGLELGYGLAGVGEPGDVADVVGAEVVEGFERGVVEHGSAEELRIDDDLESGGGF